MNEICQQFLCPTPRNRSVNPRVKLRQELDDEDDDDEEDESREDEDEENDDEDRDEGYSE